MKRILQSFTVILILLTFTLIIFNNSLLVKESVIYSVSLWLERILPTLFPMFIISKLLINYNFVDYLSKVFNKIFSKLFKVSGNSSFVFFMSLISGSPNNALIIRDLINNKMISTQEGSRILCFSHFSNPLFLYTFLMLILNDFKMTIMVILASYLGNIIIGVLLRFEPNDSHLFEISKTVRTSFSTCFVQAIKSSLDTMLMILGTVIVFIIISNILINIFNLTTISSAFLKGILEITQGLNGLVSLNTSLRFKMLVAGAFISFGGLCIHMQIKSIINDTNISYQKFLLSRIIHAIITVLILLLIS